MIRLLCWITTWIGGIFAVGAFLDKRALSGGYLMFSLSMLLELVPKSTNKSKLFSRIYYAVIIVILIVLTTLAFSGLLSSTDSNEYAFKIMFFLSLLIIIIISINFMIVLLEPDFDEPADNKIQIINNNQGLGEKDIYTVFEDKLNGGSLGNVEDGGGCDE